MKKILLFLLMILLLTGCPKIDLPGTRQPPPQPPEPVVGPGMTAMEVVNWLGLPSNGTSIGEYDRVNLDAWVYNGGETLIIFEDGVVKYIVGRGGERPSIRIHRTGNTQKRP